MHFGKAVCTLSFALFVAGLLDRVSNSKDLPRLVAGVTTDAGANIKAATASFLQALDEPKDHIHWHRCSLLCQTVFQTSHPKSPTQKKDATAASTSQK